MYILQSAISLDSLAQANSGTMEIWTPEPVISGVRSALEVYRQGLDDLAKTSLASIFRVGELCYGMCFSLAAKP